MPQNEDEAIERAKSTGEAHFIKEEPSQWNRWFWLKCTWCDYALLVHRTEKDNRKAFIPLSCERSKPAKK